MFPIGLAWKLYPIHSRILGFLVIHFKLYNQLTKGLNTEFLHNHEDMICRTFFSGIIQAKNYVNSFSNSKFCLKNIYIEKFLVRYTSFIYSQIVKAKYQKCNYHHSLGRPLHLNLLLLYIRMNQNRNIINS